MGSLGGPFFIDDERRRPVLAGSIGREGLMCQAGESFEFVIRAFQEPRTDTMCYILSTENPYILGSCR